MSRIVYFDHEEGAWNGSPFRSGDAGIVWISDEELMETDSRVHISPNALHAMEHHGVVDRLNELEIEMGPIGLARDVLIVPAAATAAARVFYVADEKTYGARYDVLVAKGDACEGDDVDEYRLVIDNREYQRSLSQLQFLCSGAARHGHGLRIRI
jgi:hypothetical protein